MASPSRSAELRMRGRDGAALLPRIAGGDETAFAAFYDTTCGLIYGLLLRILGNSETAGHVLVAVYQEVWKQAATYDDEHEKPMTWLITIARHHAIVQLRAKNQDQQYQPCLLRTAEHALPTNPETNTIASEQQRIVCAAFASLTPVEQQMIELTYFYGLSLSEIAAQLSLPLQSMQMHMQAAMGKLRRALE
jgi:RNA polymerase sigma-70 factor, ECF subfamily